MHILFLPFLALFFSLSCLHAQEMCLKDHFIRAQPGDYVVTAQAQNYCLLLIREKQGDVLTLEEIMAPAQRFSKEGVDWSRWVEEGASGNTSWVVYKISLQNAALLESFSYTKRAWCQLAAGDHFLGTLLNLRLQRMPPAQRKRVGPMPREGEVDRRPFWNPRVVVEGQTVEGVSFEAWTTRWPSDGSELSGKKIELYLPKEGARCPSYFPYWLQVGGIVGKAKVRIIDSGFDLHSPQPPPPYRFGTTRRSLS